MIIWIAIERFRAKIIRSRFENKEIALLGWAIL